MTAHRALALAVGLVVAAGPAAAQGYRARVDASSQAVSFRGLVRDSIPGGQAVATSGGGFETPDGHAVRCTGGPYCHYLRPGDALLGVPVTTSGSVVLWGLGVEGLTVRATARVVADLGTQNVWPGTNPSAQLLEGYAEYQRGAAVGRAGRQLLASRLESIGFDGGWLRARWDAASLEFTGYGGWGLDRAAVLPATSPVLNPLDEWRPRNRQLVAGAEGAWLHRNADVRAEYRREVDPLDDYFVSERAGMSFAARALALRATGGMDYNIAEGRMGSADATLTYVAPLYSVSAGARRYVPYFSLWTLWGAFSPVPYDAAHVSGQVRPLDGVSVFMRGERYRYHDAAITTGLVPPLTDRGWRASAGASATVARHWEVRGALGLEHGPGAAGSYADGGVTFTPSAAFMVDVYGGTLARPLELRFYDATTRWIGSRAEWRLDAQRRVWADVALADDQRERPDAGAWRMTQLRARAGVSVAFGSSADRVALPPALPPARRPAPGEER